MADILLSFGDYTEVHENQADEVNKIHINIGQKYWCNVYGKEGTYKIIRDGEDAIISLGYVCWIDGNSVQETLFQILISFQESQINNLKKRLIGEYVLLVKKGTSIYVFSDFMSVRNVFYSHDGMFISSSFTLVEDKVQRRASDLDTYKFLEFIAMRHVLYPTWLGRSTYHKRIKWLLPYEYLVIDVDNQTFRLGSIIYSIDNKKQSDRSLLSNELISVLSEIVARKEFKYSKVAVSLTGGHDSRLIAAIANTKFPNIRFRTAISSENPNSLKDLKVASRVSKVQQTPLDVFWFRPGRDKERFFELTEGLSPVYNHSITPLIDGAGAYALGFGGAFGTELFMPMPWNSIEDYIHTKIEGAKQALKVEDGFWEVFRESLYEQFRITKKHFQLNNSDERDYIRLFGLLVTARYGSFIISAFNRLGYQLDPYGSYSIMDLALRIAPILWGNHKRFGGMGLVQKAAMSKLNPNMGRVLTYMHSRPMLSLTIKTFPRYLIGFALQARHVLKKRYVESLKKPKRTNFPGGYYLSDGWETLYIARTAKRYGIPFIP
ncbi:MAG: hypothetical protein LUQ65_04390 [Candidatus Helarchaeota archaeon]|nr:hypothetical protein [Candidatus Helarchaeota archaeon]